MKKAIVNISGTQHLVKEGDILSVNRLDVKDNKLSFDVHVLIDGSNVKIGAPTVSGAKVIAEVVEADVRGDKVVAIRYKAKKRVNKVRGHRQALTKIKVNKIA